MPIGNRVTVKEKENIQRKMRLKWWGMEISTAALSILLQREPETTRYTLTLTSHEVDHLFNLLRFGLYQLERETENYFTPEHDPPTADDPLYVAQFRKESNRASNQ